MGVYAEELAPNCYAEELAPQLQKSSGIQLRKVFFGIKIEGATMTAS